MLEAAANQVKTRTDDLSALATKRAKTKEMSFVGGKTLDLTELYGNDLHFVQPGYFDKARKDLENIIKLWPTQQAQLLRIPAAPYPDDHRADGRGQDARGSGVGGGGACQRRDPQEVPRRRRRALRSR